MAEWEGAGRWPALHDWGWAPIGVEARGEGEGGAGREGGGEAGSCTCHAVNLSLKGLKFQSESSDEQDELLATLAPVRRARAGGMGLWRGRQVVVFLGTEVVVRKDRKAGAEGMAQVGRAEEVVARPPEKL